MALNTARDRLSARAYLYKKAWLFSCAWLGGYPGARESEVPDYASWSKARLKTHLEDLEADFAGHAKLILETSDRSGLHSFAKWMAEELERWQAGGGGLLTVCDAQTFEARFGPLQIRNTIEVPPYAELLLQGWHGLAIRHPEYMLARDLQFLDALFQESEQHLRAASWRKPPEWARYGSEHAQCLARATVQTCFNLLDSFVSGLARAHVMTHPRLDDHTKKRLMDNSRPLRVRVLNIPGWISGRDQWLPQNDPLLVALFGPIKQRRDAFVHCEPGVLPSSHGYVKETVFHDGSPAVVAEAVLATRQIIRMAWHCVHERDGPRWLTSDSQASKQGFSLVPLTRTAAAGGA